MTVPLSWFVGTGQAGLELIAAAASGIYFLGRRSDKRISPKDMVSFYDELQRLQGGQRACHIR